MFDTVDPPSESVTIRLMSGDDGAGSSFLGSFTFFASEECSFDFAFWTIFAFCGFSHRMGMPILVFLMEELSLVLVTEFLLITSVVVAWDRPVVARLDNGATLFDFS